MDNGVTKDGHVLVWHDEVIDETKCKDTGPVSANDPIYPYVGKNVANLTLAQIKTLDCGSLRLQGFPQQLTYPGHKLATMQEVFDFVECTQTPVLYNIESKVNPIQTNSTRSPEDFAKLQLKIFEDYNLVSRITYQSFDWRTLILSQKMLPELTTSALADDTTLYARAGEADATSGPSDWLASTLTISRARPPPPSSSEPLALSVLKSSRPVPAPAHRTPTRSTSPTLATSPSLMPA